MRRSHAYEQSPYHLGWLRNNIRKMSSYNRLTCKQNLSRDPDGLAHVLYVANGHLLTQRPGWDRDHHRF